MSRWYAPPRKADLSPEVQHRLQELRAATEDCERRYDVFSVERLVRAAKAVNDAFGVETSGGNDGR